MTTLRYGTCLAAVIISVSATSLVAQPALRVLPADFNADKQSQMMRAHLRGRVHRVLDRRLKTLEVALASRDALLEYQKDRREFLDWSLGEMPKRTPLNASITGRIDESGLAIEKLRFESQPRFHVTANVYRPKGAGPFPAVLHPCGHSENGKAAGAYQLANRLLARNGFVVLCYDPIGQGERKQILNDMGKPAHRASGEHQRLGAAPILLGRSLASQMVWDGVRAIDYLSSRDDVDASRIGCMGNSGGGNMTSYLMAYDARIAAAAPGCFMTTHRRKNESPGPGDAEQNLFGQIGLGFDHPDFMLVRAPRPTLILGATQDFVPIEGTWEAYRQAKRAYAVMGRPERVQLIEANAKHGFSRTLREGAARFFARWLQERSLEIVEKDSERTLDGRQLQVTPKGQVLELEGARSLFDLNIERELELAPARPEILQRSTVRRVVKVRRLERLPAPTVDLVGDELADGLQRIKMHPQPDIVLPAAHFSSGKKNPVLIAHDRGMNAAMDEAGKWRAAGHPVLLVDVRDIGETKTRNWRFFGADYYIAYMLGQPWMGMQVEDLLVAARWLAKRHHAEGVQVIAFGGLAPAAMHAAALEPELVVSAELAGGLRSWKSLLDSHDAYSQLHAVVPNALRFYDLPDLHALARIRNRE